MGMSGKGTLDERSGSDSRSVYITTPSIWNKREQPKTTNTFARLLEQKKATEETLEVDLKLYLRQKKKKKKKKP